MERSRYKTKTFAAAVLLAWGAGVAAGCASDPSAPAAAEAGDDVATVEVALTSVPGGVQCIRLVATPSAGSATTKTFTVTAGSSSASLQIGPVAPGTYTLSGDAFNLACTSISGVAPWTADPVSVTVRAGLATTLTMTFRKNSPITVNANFINNVLGVAMSFMNGFVFTDGGLLQTGVISGTQSYTRANFSAFDSSSVPGNAIAAVAASNNAVCAVRVDGTVWCWGTNSFGEVGPGVAIGASSSTPVQVTALGAATQIVGGSNHFCAISSGIVWCWGKNDAGQLGNNTTTNSANPVVVLNISNVRTLSAGSFSSYAVLPSGPLFAWGSNASGQLGDGTTTNRLMATSTLENNGVVAVAGGGNHACDLRADGSVHCWGQNFNGQLGNGTSIGSSTPVLVSGLNARQIVAAFTSSCAINTAGQTMCWGGNHLGAVGDSSAMDRTTPVAVSLGSVTLTSVVGSSSIDTFCGLAANTDLWCWGANNQGNLGDGTLNSAFAPIRPVLQ
jgi:alpha-tubulin suppressor-like RCC1 family protein